MPNPKPNIKGMDNAKNIYKLRWPKYPIDIVNYENKTKVPDEARLTCTHCKNFDTSEHIIEHHSNRAMYQTLPGM